MGNNLGGQSDISSAPIHNSRATNHTHTNGNNTASFLLNGVTPIHTLSNPSPSSSQVPKPTMMKEKIGTQKLELNEEASQRNVRIFGSTFQIVHQKTREEYFNEKNQSEKVEAVQEEIEIEDDDGEEEEELCFLNLPELVLDHILLFLKPSHLLTLRLVNHRLKSLVESHPHLPRVKVQLHSFSALKSLVRNPSIPWKHYELKDGIREFSGPVTVSNTPEWDHEFAKFISRCGPSISTLECSMLLTFSEVDRILALRHLEKFSCSGYLYSIEHIMNTKRPLDKYENVMLKRENVVLEKLRYLKLEGCSTLSNILDRTPYLSYLCVTCGIGANTTVQPSGWRDTHFTKSILDALIYYVKKRFPYKLRKANGTQLVIDFGREKTNRLSIDEPSLEELCDACAYASAVIELRNVRSKWLPNLVVKQTGSTTIEKTFSDCYNCIKSVYVESNMLNKFCPNSVKKYTMGLSLKPWFPIPFQLPKDNVEDISIYDVHNDVRQIEIDQLIRPRPQLRRLSLTESSNPLVDASLDFSFFPNLTHLQLGKFPYLQVPRNFWLLCKHLKKLRSLTLAEISEKALTVKSAGESEPALAKLRDLKQIVIKKYTPSEKSFTLLSELRLEKLHLPNTKISVAEGMSILLNKQGKLYYSLESFEFTFHSLKEDDGLLLEKMRRECPNLPKFYYRH